ncbi:MAG: hypothetical protein ACI9W6_000267 [Motiliproteus sp.]|jgi:hypothetical protein
MSTAISNLSTLLSTMEPVLHEGVYVFASLKECAGLALTDVVASIIEPEGLSVIVTEARAQELKLPVMFRAAWITLTVHSDLEAVGLTAAFATALGDAGISCNVVAGAYHDHIFVALDCAVEAMAALRELQQRSLAR